MGLKTRLYVRRMSRCCGAVTETTSYISRSTARLLKDMYAVYIAHLSTALVDRASKWWGTWAPKLGFKRRVVVRRRKRNARHLASLEQELETLKQQLSSLAGPPQPPSYPGCPTSQSPPVPAKTAKPVSPPRYTRPPAARPPKQRGQMSAARVQLRPVTAPLDEYGS